ncbi:hypothetical protein ATANTOWER_030190 [Ataeniobius toweri]|uniref:Uncharacterized protein n=1 Tax=Ataeniobius toweri TaxID=208326 RepID=A0ABU7A330_9TELE|nr:hypothetical protein [Ataeniobius toweri]
MSRREKGLIGGNKVRTEPTQKNKPIRTLCLVSFLLPCCCHSRVDGKDMQSFLGRPSGRKAAERSSGSESPEFPPPASDQSYQVGPGSDPGSWRQGSFLCTQ